MIHLYTSSTPNGHKISIMLEEGGLEYDFTYIQLGKMEQKQDWFMRLNPNGRIPVIVDADNNDFTVFESGAILLYLAEKAGQFLPTELNKRSEVIQWLMFQMGGIGPMQGQAHVFVRYAPEQIPYAIKRYQDETRRLYEVYNQRLADHEYLCGDLSIADFATAPWVICLDAFYNASERLNLLEYTHVNRWLKVLLDRQAFQKGLKVCAFD